LATLINWQANKIIPGLIQYNPNEIIATVHNFSIIVAHPQKSIMTKKRYIDFSQFIPYLFPNLTQFIAFFFKNYREKPGRRVNY
jgi:hypothetical protein